MSDDKRNIMEKFESKEQSGEVSDSASLPCYTSKGSKYTGCKSWKCQQCVNYQKFLSVASMQDICWNRRCSLEEV